jgi:hypothetical protein
MFEHIGDPTRVAGRCCHSPGRNLIDAYDDADIAILDVSATNIFGLPVPILRVA